MCYKIATLDNLVMETAMRPPQQREDGAAQRAAPSVFSDLKETLAALGIDSERVLLECAYIAFADIRNVVSWDEDGIMKAVKPSGELGRAEAAAIAEVIASAKDTKIYRVKMHDKKPLLILLLRYLDSLTGHDDDSELDDGEDPREFLKRELARIAARSGHK
jgi:hypothetical protein